MSADDQGGAGRREVAYRVFAAEYDDADFSYSESDEERAPNYVVLPTGARVNRLFVVGVLTETERASEEVLRARIVDPTGAFVVYAGQYQPDALTFLERADPPAFVALTGKARTFQPEDSEVTYTSIRPESANEVDAGTRDRWTVGAARQTLERVGTIARALTYEERGDELRARLESEGVDVGLAAGIPLAIDHYGTTATYLDAVRRTAIQAAEVVAGERDEVDPLTVRPDEQGSVDPASLAGTDADTATAGGPAVATGGESGAATGPTEASAGPVADTDGSTGTPAGTPTGTDGETGSDATEPTGTGGEAGTEAEADVGVRAEADAETETGTDPGAGGTAAESAASGEEDTVGGGTGAAGPADGELEDFEPGEFELDEEEREEIEREYGTDFQSGTEVDQPGEADIETPAPETDADTQPVDADETPSADTDETPLTDTDDTPSTDAGETRPADTDEAAVGGTGSDTGVERATDDGEEPTDAGTVESAGAEATETIGTEATETAPDPDNVDVEEAVMDAMRANDDGPGAPESDIVDAVVEGYGVGEDEVAGAIQDALMDGRCYEAEDGVYKPI